MAVALSIYPEFNLEVTAFEYSLGVTSFIGTFSEL